MNSPTRVPAATEIATIGIWDPAYERHDLENVDVDERLAALRSEARAGRLFFIDTFSDGEYAVDVYVDEVPDADLLALCSQVNREFLIVSESGRLLVGGLEGFTKATKQPASPDHSLAVSPGRYALTLHELRQGQVDDADNLRRVLGADDYADYENQKVGFPLGCLLFVAGIGLLLLQFWYLAGAAFAVWLGYLFLRPLMRPPDRRLQELDERLAEYRERLPAFVVTLRTLPESAELEGGWFHVA